MYTPVVIVSGNQLGRTSQIMRCPICHNVVFTKMRSSVNTDTHLIALILCGFGCWPCVPIPYCIRSCQDVDHYCPICDTYLGTVVVVAGTQVGRESQTMTCPSCHAQIRTKTKGTITSKTHITALLLCLFCCWPCLIIPYCTNSCKNIDHYCPNCEAYIGSYIR